MAPGLGEEHISGACNNGMTEDLKPVEDKAYKEGGRVSW